jgi:hypothetical protein
MKTNLKVILLAMGAATLLASPATSKTVRAPAYAAAPIPGSVGGPSYTNEGGPYTPSIPTALRWDQNRDFQTMGSR